MIIEDRVLRRVETGLGHLAGHGHADGVAHALAERPGGALDAGRLAKLRVARSLAVELTEIFQLLEREVVAAEVQPAVKEHAAVARGENEAVAVEPARFVRVVHERVPVEHGADLGGAEGQAEVAGGGLVDGIDGEAAGLGTGLGENLGVKLHG